MLTLKKRGGVRGLLGESIIFSTVGEPKYLYWNSVKVN